VTCKELNFALEASNQKRFAASWLPSATTPGSPCRRCTAVVRAEGDLHAALYGCPLDNPEELAARGLDRRAAAAPGKVKAWPGGGHPARPVSTATRTRQPVDHRRRPLAYLDFGIMGELAPSWRELLRDMALHGHVRPRLRAVARGCAGAACWNSAVGTTPNSAGCWRAVRALLDAPISRLNSRRITDMLLPPRGSTPARRPRS